MLGILLIFFVSPAVAHEFSGYLEVEGRLFFDDPQSTEQRRHNGSLALQPEYYHQLQNDSSFTLTPFLRLDSADAERTHFDIRELNYLWLGESWELRLGVGKVFWGTTEFVHLVDIINQTDLVEGLDEEEKLGQPMIHLSVLKDWGVVDLFVLPGFRERTFPGRKGRLRSHPAIDTDKATYESSREERHIDFALRYSHTIGNWDLGLYHFQGTGREPTLLPGQNENGEPILIPFYEQIDQTGFDLQLVAGQMLWKLETLHRSGQGKSFFAAIGGFEYTLVGIADTAGDLGLVFEYAWDERGDAATSSFDNDLMAALRLAVNDAAGSELLLGISQSLDSSARSLKLEASRRLGDRWKLSVEAYGFFEVPVDDPLFGLQDDDFIQLDLAYYF